MGNLMGVHPFELQEYHLVLERELAALKDLMDSIVSSKGLPNGKTRNLIDSHTKTMEMWDGLDLENKRKITPNEERMLTTAKGF